jgi:hypothetical protein
LSDRKANYPHKSRNSPDKAYKFEGKLTHDTVLVMEDLIAGMLANQLAGYFKEAEGA